MAGTYYVDAAVELDDYQLIAGQGYKTQIVPSGDTRIFSFIAPLTRCIVRDMFLYDSSHLTTSQPAIYFDTTGGSISLCTIENIQTYYFYGCIWTTEGASDIDYSVLSCTFQNVYANDFEHQGFKFFSCFDCRFIDMYAFPYDTDATFGFRFENSIASGSMFNMITCLGRGESQGFVLNEVGNVYVSNLICDYWDDCIYTANTVEYVSIANVEVRSAQQYGINGAHDTGRVSISGLTALTCVSYGVININNGGNFTVVGGTFASNGATYSLQSGDVLFGCGGATDYP